MKVTKKLVILVIGSLLIFQFALLLVYSYLFQINQAPFQIGLDPVGTFLMSWVLLWVGVVIIVIGR